MSLDDFSPAGDAEEPRDDLNDLDEDLFDFPPVDVPEASARPAEPSESELDAALDQTSPALPANEPEQATAGSIDMQLEEEDLLDAPSVAGGDAIPAAPPSAAASPGASAGDIDDEVEQLMREAKEEQRRAEERRQSQRRAAAPPAEPQPAVEPAPALPLASPEAPLAPVQVPVVSTGGSPALWVFTALSACFMAGLLFIAWNFTSAYERRLDAQPEDTGLAQFEPAPAFETTQVETETPTRPDPDDRSEATRRGGESIPPLESFHDSVLAVADSAIADGRFNEARRMVYGLLAELDRLPPEARQEVERRSAYLIAFSHEAEADHLRESLQ